MSIPADCESQLPARRSSLDANSVRLSYLEWGRTGRPALLLHGITSSARSWWRVAPALVSHGYHVYALDMPGHGESATTNDHRIDAIAGLVGAALQQLAPDGAIVIGHSWGGATALALASVIADCPPLRQVVLADPAMRMTPERGAALLPDYAANVSKPRDEARPIIEANNPGWHACDVFWKLEALEQCRYEAVRGFFVASGTWDLTPQLALVRVPLLLLVADPQFTVIAPDVLRAAEQALRPDTGKLMVVPGTDHNMLRGGFATTMPILLDWLASW